MATASWMWGDASIIGHKVAQKNPLRWSKPATLQELIDKFGAFEGKDADRPMDVKLHGLRDKPRRYANAAAAAAALSELPEDVLRQMESAVSSTGADADMLHAACVKACETFAASVSESHAKSQPQDVAASLLAQLQSTRDKAAVPCGALNSMVEAGNTFKVFEEQLQGVRINADAGDPAVLMRSAATVLRTAQAPFQAEVEAMEDAFRAISNADLSTDILDQASEALDGLRGAVRDALAAHGHPGGDCAAGCAAWALGQGLVELQRTGRDADRLFKCFTNTGSAISAALAAAKQASLDTTELGAVLGRATDTCAQLDAAPKSVDLQQLANLDVELRSSALAGLDAAEATRAKVVAAVTLSKRAVNLLGSFTHLTVDRLASIEKASSWLPGRGPPLDGQSVLKEKLEALEAIDLGPLNEALGDAAEGVTELNMKRARTSLETLFDSCALQARQLGSALQVAESLAAAAQQSHHALEGFRSKALEVTKHVSSLPAKVESSLDEFTKASNEASSEVTASAASLASLPIEAQQLATSLQSSDGPAEADCEKLAEAVNAASLRCAAERLRRAAQGLRATSDDTKKGVVAITDFTTTARSDLESAVLPLQACAPQASHLIPDLAPLHQTLAKLQSPDVAPVLAALESASEGVEALDGALKQLIACEESASSQLHDVVHAFHAVSNAFDVKHIGARALGKIFKPNKR